MLILNTNCHCTKAPSARNTQLTGRMFAETQETSVNGEEGTNVVPMSEIQMATIYNPKLSSTDDVANTIISSPHCDSQRTEEAATQKAEAGGPPEPRSSKPSWATQQDPISEKRTHSFSQAADPYL